MLTAIYQLVREVGNILGCCISASERSRQYIGMLYQLVREIANMLTAIYQLLRVIANILGCYISY